MKSLKKTLAWLLCAVLLVGMLPVAALAGEYDCTVTIASGTISGEANDVTIPVTVADFPDEVGAYKFSVEYDHDVFSGFEIITSYTYLNNKNKEVTAYFTDPKATVNNATAMLNCASATGISLDGDEDDETVIFKIHLTKSENAYNGDYDIVLLNKGDAESYLHPLSGNEHYNTALVAGKVTIENGKVPTLAKVSVTDSKGMVSEPSETWSRAVTVDGVNDQTFELNTYSDQDTAMSATWATEDTALTLLGNHITVKKDAAAGAHTATATAGETVKTFTFNVTRAASTAASIAITPEMGTEIVLPGIGEPDATQAFTATVYDQFGDALANQTLTWYIEPKSTGVSVSDSGVVTVTSAASVTAEPIAVWAQISDKVKNDAKFSIVKENAGVATSVSVVEGPSTITIDKTNGVTASFKASAKDKYGVTVDPLPAFTWVLDAGGTGATLSATTGEEVVLTVPATAVGGTVTLTVSAGNLTADPFAVAVNDLEFPNAATAVQTAAALTYGASWENLVSVTGLQGKLGDLTAEITNPTFSYKINDTAAPLPVAGSNVSFDLYLASGTFGGQTYSNVKIGTFTYSLAKKQVGIQGAVINNKEYDGTTAASTGTDGPGSVSIGPTIGSDSPRYTADFAFTAAAAGTVTFNVTNVALDPTDPVSANYELTQTSYSYTGNGEGSGSITKKALTISNATAINSKTYDGTRAGTGTVVLAGAASGETPVATGTFLWGDNTAGTTAFIVSDIALTDAAVNANYTLSQTGFNGSGTNTITPATLTIASASIDPKTYDGTTAGTGTVALSGAVNNEEPVATGVFAWNAAAAGTTGFTVTASLTNAAVNANYVLNASQYNGTDANGIAQATNTIPAITTPWLLKGSETADGNAQTFALPTLITYPAVTGQTAGKVSYVVKTYGSALTDARVAIDDSENLVITIAKAETPAANTTDELVVTVLGENYANQDVTIPFKFVDKKDVSNDITFADISYTYNKTSDYTVAATLASAATSGTWTYTYEGTGYPASETKPVNAGTYTVTATYDDDVAITDYPAGQHGVKTATLTIAPIEAAIVWSGAGARAYDGGKTVVTAEVSNLVAGDECTVTVTGGDEKNVGPHTATVTELSNPNYALPETPVTADYVIEAVELTLSGVKAQWDSENNVAILYDGTLNGKVAETDVDFVLGEATVEDKTPGTEKTVGYEPTLTGKDAGNYVLGAYNAVTVDIPLEVASVAETVKTDATVAEGVEIVGIQEAVEKVSATAPASSGVSGIVAAATTVASDESVITADVLTDATAAAENLVGYDETTNPATIVVQPGISVEVTAGNATSITVEVSAYYELRATTKDVADSGVELDDTNSTAIGTPKDLTVNGAIELKLPVPASFNGQLVYIWHEHNGKTYQYTATATGDDLNGYFVTFTSKYGLSPFELSLNSKANVIVGDESYETLQAAIDNVEDGGTIHVAVDMAAEDVTVDREVTFTVTEEVDGYFKGTITAANGYTLTEPAGALVGEYVITKQSGGHHPKSGGSSATQPEEQQPQPKTGFVDVPAGSYFEDAVAWAVGKGVTQGTTATTFSPNAPCTRAQAVTFLYRVAGEPEVELGETFTDVASDAYYAKAVAWAL
ncbi:MAG: S-layer homology domain-containing protein, partial [Oscillibacter sp.]|nr:S-layer homology domain-containing protein [Oscillibacter sp.]